MSSQSLEFLGSFNFSSQLALVPYFQEILHFPLRLASCKQGPISPALPLGSSLIPSHSSTTCWTQPDLGKGSVQG